MVLDRIELGARALAQSENGVDDFDGLDEELKERLRENVRAVLAAVDEADAIPRLDLNRPASEQGFDVEKPND